VADHGQIRTFTMAHRDDEVWPDKYVQLRKDDSFVAIPIASCPENDEYRVFVFVELGPLMSPYRILYCELMQAELVGNGGELLFCGSKQPEPGDSGVLAAQVVGFTQ
jgi:hypothetical protein